MTDNIVFWLTGQMIHFGIAKSMQEKHDCNLFAIIDIGNEPKKFYSKQQIVKFQKTWFYHDHISPKNKKPDIEYLKQIEKKYNLDLWVLAYNERLFYEFNDYYKFSTDEILSILEQECKLFEEVIEISHPNFLIMEPPNLHSEQLFYEICKSKGIKPLLLGMSRFGYKSFISTEAEKLDHVEESDNFIPSRTIEELKEYQKQQNLSKNIKEFTKNTLNSRLSLVKSLSNFLSTKNTNIHTHYSYYGRTKSNVLVRSLIQIFKKKYRQNFIDRNLVKTIEYNTPFIYYPMFAEPERVILIGSPFYTNQLEIIKQIAKSIPIGHQLYVKEHPMMNIVWRKTSTYKQIIDLPNVVLIHPSVPSEELMKKCSLVISTAGNSALEAIFHGKSSITFADIGLIMIPFVHKVTSINELSTLIKNSLKEKVDPLILNKYVDSVEKQSFDFDYLQAIADYESHFYYGGYLVEVNIKNSQMESYLKKHKSTFDKLADEHIKILKNLK